MVRLIKQRFVNKIPVYGMQPIAILVLLIFSVACNSQNKSQVDTPKLITNPENGFNCGLLDSDGNLWFGSNGGGVYKYNGKTFARYAENEGLHHSQVLSMIEDKNGALWFGTSNGMYKMEGKTFTHIPIPFSDTTSIWLDKVYPTLNPNAVHSLIEDNEGNIWIGTGGNGAYRYDGKQFTPYLRDIGRKQEDSLYHNWIPCIMEDTDENIWFASMTHGGVSRYDGEKFTHYQLEDGLSDDMVRTIYQDQSGKIWFGFNGNRNSGLTYYNGQSFHTYYEHDGLCNTNIIAIYKDKKGGLWLGSGRTGLCHFDGNNFKEIKLEDDSSHSGVLVVLEDTKGDIWIGGDKGLWHFDGHKVQKMTK